MDLAGEIWNGFAVFVDLSRLSNSLQATAPDGKKNLKMADLSPQTFVLGSELYLSILHRECYCTLR